MLKIIPRNFGMAREDGQLAEMITRTETACEGDTLLFPEFGAYTAEGSETACTELSRVAVRTGITLITTLNLAGEDLPHAEPGKRYNTVVVFSRTGRTYFPQAKITPQSFEMWNLDPAYPEINVTPYDHLNSVTLRQNGRDYRAFFLICSDLYVLQIFDHTQLESDALLCPANFGNGAEASAGRVIDYAVQSGIFRKGFFSNSYQKVKEGRTPLTVGVERTFEIQGEKRSYRKEEMVALVKKSSAVYPDGPRSRYTNFLEMLSLTRNGTFTVPRSRSLENGLKVELGVYEPVIEL